MEIMEKYLKVQENEIFIKGNMLKINCMQNNHDHF